MYCAFIDFEKAFDSVWRIGLWQKLLSSNINGKCFRIYQIYNCSFLWLKMFVNRLNIMKKKKVTNFLLVVHIKGIESVTKALEKDINVYLKLFVLYMLMILYY